MNAMESIDKRPKESEVRTRKKFLINELKKMDLEKSADGRRLEDLSLYSLEWMHVNEKNKAAKAYGEEEH